jgi:hypothetical protein
MYKVRYLIACLAILITLSLILTCVEAATQGKSKGRSKEPANWQKKEKKYRWVPPGLSKKELAEWKKGKPPGWSKGKKKGWRGANMPPGLLKKGGKLPSGLERDMPPGWGKWDDKRKKAWQKELRKAKQRVRFKAKSVKNFFKKDLNSALVSIEMSARRGVPIKHALNFIENAMEKGIKGRGIETATRAMAYGVSREIDFDQLSKFIQKKLNEGLRNDKLSIEIYKEIVRCYEKKLKTKEAIHKKKEKGEEL